MELYLPSSFLAHAFACSIPFLVDLRIASAESIMYGAGGSGCIYIYIFSATELVARRGETGEKQEKSKRLSSSVALEIPS